MNLLPECWNHFSPLKQRIISAAVLGIVFLGIIAVGSWPLGFAVALMAALAYREYLPLVQTEWPKALEYGAYVTLVAASFFATAVDMVLGLVPVLIGFVFLAVMSHLYIDKGKRSAPPWICVGLLYIAVPSLCMIWLRDIGSVVMPKTPWLLLLLPMVGVWMTDTGAYFTGRRVGGPKIWTKISPNKTWSGLVGGIVASSLTMGALALAFAVPYAVWFFVIGAVLAVVAQIGDFFESWLKRTANVKDSGTIIPGHGGILDRIDGVLFALPCFALFVRFFF